MPASDRNTAVDSAIAAPRAATPLSRWRLALVCGAVALAIIFFYFTRPVPRGSFVESQIQACRQDQQAPGVVLDVTRLRTREIYESRRPWNRGAIFASGWRQENTPATFDARFGGFYCGDTYPAGQRIRNYLHPDTPNASSRMRLEGIPAEFAPFIEEWSQD